MMTTYYLKKTAKAAGCIAHPLRVGGHIGLAAVDHQDINAMMCAAANQNEKYRLHGCSCQCIVVDESEKPVV